MSRPAESRHSPAPPAERVRGGFFAIPPTPFTADGEVDEASLVGVIRHQIEIGVDGLLLLAVASEAMFLTATEKQRIVQRVARGGGRLSSGAGGRLRARPRARWWSRRAAGSIWAPRRWWFCRRTR